MNTTVDPATGSPAPLDARLFRRSLWLLGLLAVSALLGYLAPPELLNHDPASRKRLEAVIPQTFGTWRIDPSLAPLLPSPDQVALLGEIYDETVSRTYVNDRGERVMLSLAYGRNQSRRFQIHKPEVCYVGQGFRLVEQRFSALTLRSKEVPVMELVAVQGKRIEPITYWIRIGDELGRGWVEQNTIRVKYALRGQIPDGLLFRLSTISRGDLRQDFAVQQRFAQDLSNAVADSDMPALIGNLPGPNRGLKGP